MLQPQIRWGGGRVQGPLLLGLPQFTLHIDLGSLCSLEGSVLLPSFLQPSQGLHLRKQHRPPPCLQSVMSPPSLVPHRAWH